MRVGSLGTWSPRDTAARWATRMRVTDEQKAMQGSEEVERVWAVDEERWQLVRSVWSEAVERFIGCPTDEESNNLSCGEQEELQKRCSSQATCVGAVKCQSLRYRKHLAKQNHVHSATRVGAVRRKARTYGRYQGKKGRGTHGDVRCRFRVSCSEVALVVQEFVRGVLARGMCVQHY